MADHDDQARRQQPRRGGLARGAAPASRRARAGRPLRRRRRAGRLRRRRARAAPGAGGLRRGARPERRRRQSRRRSCSRRPSATRCAARRCTSICCACDLDEAIHAVVPLELEGVDDAPGVKEGGVLEQITRELNVEALPTAIPESIVHAVGEMQIGETIVLARSATPEGVTLLDDPRGDGRRDAVAAAPAGRSRGGNRGRDRARRRGGEERREGESEARRRATLRRGARWRREGCLRARPRVAARCERPPAVGGRRGRSTG